MSEGMNKWLKIELASLKDEFHYALARQDYMNAVMFQAKAQEVERILRTFKEAK